MSRAERIISKLGLENELEVNCDQVLIINESDDGTRFMPLFIMNEKNEPDDLINHSITNEIIEYTIESHGDNVEEWWNHYCSVKELISEGKLDSKDINYLSDLAKAFFNENERNALFNLEKKLLLLLAIETAVSDDHERKYYIAKYNTLEVYR